MNDTLKTLSISLCSSLCTALLVVACTAGADKPDDDDETEWGSGTDDEWAPGGGTGSDAGPDGVTSAELTDCVLREMASWAVDEEAADYPSWEGDYIFAERPTCAVQLAYNLCGESLPINEHCYWGPPETTEE
jgi:hypothetical protein